ncbi:Extracellular serine/threonine protein kinase four-jointed [Halotydeus destructor]|nr:Extracellular serine/threonine protein kinase four-jointed [Halotydeus destructor]
MAVALVTAKPLDNQGILGHHLEPAAPSLPFIQLDIESTNDVDSVNGHQLGSSSDEPAANGSLVEDHVFWSPAMEALLPTSDVDQDDAQWLDAVSHGSATELTEGCGRSQNRRLVLADGSAACARYRHNDDQIQGDIYSFVLSRLLNISNVPPTVLVGVGDHMLDSVQKKVRDSGWRPGKAIVLSQQVGNLGPAYIPKGLRTVHKRLRAEDLRHLNTSQLVEIAQWTDLIIFDYVIANLDRVVNNMFNQQWNADMMSHPAHNLATNEGNGKLVFVDNESGLLHGYRLLAKYESYHKALLDAVCLFRRPTVDRVLGLLAQPDLGQVMVKSLARYSLAGASVAPLPDRNLRLLRQRLKAVVRQVNKCKSLYQS